MNKCTFSFCKTEGSFKIIIIMPNEFPFDVSNCLFLKVSK